VNEFMTCFALVRHANLASAHMTQVTRFTHNSYI
jgi:hypothetical protein